MLEYTIRQFNSDPNTGRIAGLVTEIEDSSSIPENAASSSLNWLTFEDRIELSGFYDIVGTENTGTGKITGLHVGELVNGDKQAFRTYGQKIEYYDNTAKDWSEIGTNQLGSSADGEDVSFTGYVSLAGYQTWLSSPNSSLYKIMNANPGSIKDMYDASYNYKGYIISANNRLLLWNRDKFKNVLYGSFKDVQNTTVYTTVSAEAIGVLGSVTYSGTLSEATGKRTVFNLVITDGTLTVQDDKNGNLTGDGTGTINYSTGAYSVTFSGTTTGAVTADYQYEDSTNGNGLGNFTFSATRVATEGFILFQTTGGDILNIMPYKTGDVIDYYCLHENNCWIYSMPSSDLLPYNEPYREKVGMKNWRAAIATGDGIYYIDTSDTNKPRLKLITLNTSGDKVEPIVISYNIDLSDYSFNNAVSYEWGNYILFACSTGNNNNRLFVFNKIYKTFDVLKYYVSTMVNNNGVLWAGDSISNNVQRLFTGTSANNSIPENFWIGMLSQLQIDEIKRFKKLTLRGFIAKSQSCKVFISYDGGNFTEIGTIEGTGSYVDLASANTVGTGEVGGSELGGGTSGNQKYRYIKEFKVNSPKFDEAQIKIVAQNAGYLSVNYINYHDITVYGQKNLTRYNTV